MRRSLLVLMLVCSTLALGGRSAQALNISFSSAHPIGAPNGPVGTTADDLNHDGDIDFASASQFDDTVAWYESSGGTTPTFTQHIISTDQDGAVDTFIGDLNGDGDKDILATSFTDNTVAWYESSGGASPTFTQHVISTTVTSARWVTAGDIDGDTKPDVLVAASTNVYWFKSDGGSPPTFGTAKNIQGGLTDVRMVQLADMDKDGDLDPLYAAAGTNLIRWNENTPTVRGNTAGWSSTAHDVGPPTTPWSVDAADVDHDGDIDVVSESAANDVIRVFLRNPGTGITYATNNSAGSGLVDEPRDARVVDVDSDGDLDIVSSAFSGDAAHWQENNGASPPGWTTHTIATGLDGARTIVPADVDGDGDPDVMVASALGNQLNWFSNLTPKLSIDDVSVNEGGIANFTVSVTDPQPDAITFNYTTVDGTASAGSDYTAVTNGSNVMPANQTSVNIQVNTLQDASDEGDEIFEVHLSSPVNARIVDGTGVATINDDDAVDPGQSLLTINDVGVTEGGIATFTVTANPMPTSDVTFHALTTAHSADASDFTALSNTTFTILANTSTKQISIQTTQDLVDEPDERFGLNIGTPSSNATVGDPEGLATIFDDDAPVHLTVNDVSVTEGDPAVFTVTADTTPTSDVHFTVNTSDGQATQPGDYTAIAATQKTISAGTRTTTVSVPTVDDSTDENDEAFSLILSNPTFDPSVVIDDFQGLATIQDNDGAPSLSINDVTQKEGKKGFTNFVFTVSLSATSGKTVTFDWTTADGKAVAVKDYTASSGNDVAIVPGASSTTVTVPVKGDRKREKSETFFVLLSDSQSASTADAQGTGTIKNDDH